MVDGIIQQIFKQYNMMYRSNSRWNTKWNKEQMQQLIEKIKQESHTEQLSNYPHLTLYELIGDNKEWITTYVQNVITPMYHVLVEVFTLTEYPSR